MSAWWKRVGGPADAPLPDEAAAASPPAPEADAGQYHPLYVYLRDRYADRVVLSFTDMEGLLGFALPQAARTAVEWWAGPSPSVAASRQSGAWTLASRSASANMAARHVVFDRLTPAR